MRLLSFAAGSVAALGIVLAMSADAAELRLSAAALDRVVAGDDAEIGQSLSFAGLSNFLVRTINVPMALPFPVLDGSGIGDLPPPSVFADPAPQFPIGLGRRDLAAAFRLVLGG